MIDARRMEVYTATYGEDLQSLDPVTALILEDESVQHFSKFPSLGFFGDGMEKAQDLLSKLPDAHLLKNIRPSSKDMGILALEKYKSGAFEDTAYFEPYYLKEFQAGKKKT